jgi:hypothetical protein
MSNFDRMKESSGRNHANMRLQQQQDELRRQREQTGFADNVRRYQEQQEQKNWRQEQINRQSSKRYSERQQEMNDRPSQYDSEGGSGRGLLAAIVGGLLGLLLGRKQSPDGMTDGKDIEKEIEEDIEEDIDEDADDSAEDIPSIADTEAFIKKTFAGKVDAKGEPLWAHSIAVMKQMDDMNLGSTHDERYTALLYNLIGHTSCTLADLKNMGYPKEVIRSVELLTRPAGIGYLKWIKTLARSGNRMAILVKLAELEITDPDPDAHPDNTEHALREALAVMRKASI